MQKSYQVKKMYLFVLKFINVLKLFYKVERKFIIDSNLFYGLSFFIADFRIQTNIEKYTEKSIECIKFFKKRAEVNPKV